MRIDKAIQFIQEEVSKDPDSVFKPIDYDTWKKRIPFITLNIIKALKGKPDITAGTNPCLIEDIGIDPSDFEKVIRSVIHVSLYNPKYGKDLQLVKGQSHEGPNVTVFYFPHTGSAQVWIEEE